METLEQSVKRSQMALAVIERALNDSTGWTIGGEGVMVDAQVITSDAGVTFWTVFPTEWPHLRVEMSYSSMDRVVIGRRGEVLWVAHVHPPEAGPFEVEVTLLLAQTVAA